MATLLFGIAASSEALAQDSVGTLNGLSMNLGTPTAPMAVVDSGVLEANKTKTFEGDWTAVIMTGTWATGDAAALSLLIGKYPDGSIHANFSGATGFHFSVEPKANKQCSWGDLVCVHRSGNNVVVTTNPSASLAYLVLK